MFLFEIGGDRSVYDPAAMKCAGCGCMSAYVRVCALVCALTNSHFISQTTTAVDYICNVSPFVPKVYPSQKLARYFSFLDGPRTRQV